MMNLIVIEDEPPILRAIKSITVSFPEHFTILHTFNNGETALNYLNDNNKMVDAILTDIQIPVLTGLELIKIVHEKWPHISNIIITGYNNFSYAQKSISLHVANYLLKPIDENELHKELISIMRKNFSLAISNSTFIPNNYPLPISSPPSYYSLAVVGKGNIPFSESSITYDPENFFNKIEVTNKIPKNGLWYFNMPNPSEKLFVILSVSPDITHKEKLIKEIFKPYMENSDSYTVVYSSNPPGFSSMNTYIGIMTTLLHQSVIIGKSQLINYRDHNNKRINKLDALQSETVNLKKLFINSDIKLFRAELKQLILKLEQSDYNLLSVYQYFFNLISLCLSEVNLPENTEALINKAVRNSTSYIKLYKNILIVFHKYFNYLICSNNSAIDKEQLLIKIDQYITNHFTEDINSQQLADEFNFTPSYLSKLFTEYKKLSPTKYIITLRIQKAKDLLSHKNLLNIKEVANFVGYEDPLYFSKVFKKETGLSPKQFMQRNTQ